MALEFPTRAERPGKLPHADSLAAPWPEFMYHDLVLERLFGRVIAEYAEFHFYAWDNEREEVVGVGNAIPVAWDGDRASLPDGGSRRSGRGAVRGGSTDADRPLRSASRDRSRVSRPGPQQPHD